jgi:hypothetical protein
MLSIGQLCVVFLVSSAKCGAIAPAATSEQAQPAQTGQSIRTREPLYVANLSLREDQWKKTTFSNVDGDFLAIPESEIGEVSLTHRFRPEDRNYDASLVYDEHTVAQVYHGVVSHLVRSFPARIYYTL